MGLNVANLSERKLKTVLFDLDGTLLDTAADLGGALNTLLEEHNKPPLGATILRQHVSNGGNALVSLGFGTKPSDANHNPLYKRLLEIYGRTLTLRTKPFPGIEQLLLKLHEQDIGWGVVTNKPRLYAAQIMQVLDLQPTMQVLVCPEDVKRSKPFPDAIFKACELIDCSVNEAIYVGDHARDIEAGRNAGMVTVAAAYGYIEQGDSPSNWRADHQIDQPLELLALI